jgi:DNA topoisomerase VI subunit B
MQKLERTTFETSRTAEYFDARQLSTLTGVAQHEFASVCLKELIDNALDACETAGVAPKVGIEVDTEEVVDEGGCWAHPDGLLRITVSDNGPGIPPETVRKVLNFNTRTSDKAAYRSPTRGAQGNALKTLIGIPYALGHRGAVVVEARGLRHEIRPWVDPAGEVRIAHEKEPKETAGTKVEVVMPRYVAASGDVQDFDPLHWVRSFAAFNPHASFSYLGKSGPHEGAEMYKATRDTTKKYVPSEPTSPHWYGPASLKTLVFSHIADAEKNGGRDLPLGQFVRQFQGLARTAKAKAVCSRMADFKHLSGFKGDPDAVSDLLEAMQEESKPPKASALGFVGKEHFRAFFESIYEVKEFKYVKREGSMPSGLPLTFEFAFANIGEDHGHLYTAINFSPTFGDPLEGTTLVGSEFKAGGIVGFLSQGHALPKSERAWYLSPTNVAVAAHIATPAPIYLDRGKTRLNMERA